MKTEKRFGRVFTPSYLVEDILDFAGYASDGGITEKHVIDNSCGEGAFLVEIADRYCDSFAKSRRRGGVGELRRQLETFVHGIEIDAESCRRCIANLDAVAVRRGLPKVNWDVRNADAMDVDAFDGKMDFVVGNPPYVRVHNLDDDFAKVKRYSFCGGGMTDLYLVFYEIGLGMLSPNGRLCYIAPSSWLNSVAGRRMRERLRDGGCLRGIVDLGHFQPFDATAYTAITLLSKSDGGRTFSYGVYDAPHKIRRVCELPYEDAFFDDALFLGDEETLRNFRAVKTARVPRSVTVKNGFATLADGVFIADEFPFAEHVIPVVKASTGKWRKAFYPYDGDGNPLPKERIFSDNGIAAYLNGRKRELLKGRDERDCADWFLYGRTQALKDVRKRKYAINNLAKDVASVKLNYAPEGSGVYSGLYILTDAPESRLRAALECEDFIKYASVLKKYKSGGYYTFNSRELEQYLNCKLRNWNGKDAQTDETRAEAPLD